MTRGGTATRVYLDAELLAWVSAYGASGQTLPGQVRELLETLRHLVEQDRTRFDEREALALADAVNGWFMEPLSMPYLWAEVDDAVRNDGLAERWGIDGTALVGRLRDELTACERVVVALKLRRAWQMTADGATIAEALRSVGLVAA